MPSVVLMILFFTMISSTHSFADSPAPSPTPEFSVQLSAEPTQFDPLLMEDGTALKIAANTIATPYEYDNFGNVKKSLLEGISISRDRRTYTFQFKKDLKWSDGVKFHADHFMLALKRLVNQPVKAALSEFFPEIDLKKSKVLDARTVQIVLVEPDALFLHWCTLPPFAPIRQDMIDIYAQKRTPVVPTLAAYSVVDYQRDEFLELKKNPEYFAKSGVTLQDVKVRFIKDEAAILPLLKSGSLDVLTRVPVLQLNQIRERSTLVETKAEAITYLGFNTKKAPFNEVKNRRAFRDALVTMKHKLAESLKTGEIPASIFLPQVLWPPGYNGAQTIEKPKEMPEISFSAQSDVGSRNQNIMEFVQDVVRKELHWKMNLEMMEWATHYAKVKSDPDEVFRMGWQNPVSDPFVMYQVLRGNGVNNFTGWSNSDYDRLIRELRDETRLVKKAALVKKIEELLYSEAPVVPLLQQVLRYSYSKRVLGFRANSFGVILFRELRFNEKAD